MKKSGDLKTWKSQPPSVTQIAGCRVKQGYLPVKMAVPLSGELRGGLVRNLFNLF
jgi:hypothetical protein